MKNTPQIVKGGGWRGTRAYRIKIGSSCALIIANVLAFIAFIYSDTTLFYIWIPALISFIVSIILFIREQPTKIELLSGKVGADPRKLYGNYGSNGVDPEQQNKAEQAAPDLSVDRLTETNRSLQRKLYWSIGSFVMAASILAIHQIYVARTMSDHIAAGGIDDPDAVLGRFHILIIPLVLIPMLIAFIAMLVFSFSYCMRRHRCD